MSLNVSGAAAVPIDRAGALDQRFALDVQGVDALRRTTRVSPQEGLKQVSRQFEAMFMQMVLKSMRDATPSDGLFGSEQEKMFTAMLDQQLAQSLSGRGLGLAEAMQAQLSRSLPAQAQAQQEPAPPASQPQQEPAPPASRPQQAPAPAAGRADLSFYDAGAGRAARQADAGAASSHIERFVGRMSGAAQSASRASGVPAQLILAQAALESGWGRREIRAGDGSPTYNLFGIKAGKGWNGPVAEVVTTEYVDGAPQRVKANFRVYASYDEAFADYARFLSANPRYAPVLAARDPGQAAQALQRASYATDPEYGGKLARIMKQIG